MYAQIKLKYLNLKFIKKHLYLQKEKKSVQLYLIPINTDSFY